MNAHHSSQTGIYIGAAIAVGSPNPVLGLNLVAAKLLFTNSACGRIAAYDWIQR
jgi:hypothetical protein